MSNVEIIPVACIWLKPDQVRVVPDQEVMEAVASGGYEPIQVYRDPRLGIGNYGILKGVQHFEAAKKLKTKTVLCVIQHGHSFFRELRDLADPMAWAEMAEALVMAGYSLDHVVEQSHIPRSVVLDRLDTRKRLKEGSNRSIEILMGRINDPVLFARTAKDILDQNQITILQLALRANVSQKLLEERLEMLRAIDAAEEHGKVMGRAEKVQDDNEAMIRGNKRAGRVVDGKFCNLVELCTACMKHKSLKDGLCLGCIKAKAIEESRSPKERGLVQCLEAGCPKWIKNPMRRVLPLQATYYFCKVHQVKNQEDIPGSGNVVGWQTRSLSNMPEFDRDGDPIWVTREGEVIKVKEMGDSHLTNCLVCLEGAAKRRCQITGIDESKWPERAGNRYEHLVKEAKRRDEALKCPCKDGVAEVRSIEGDPTVTFEVLCTKCQLGIDRKAAKEAAEALAKSRKGKKALTMKMAMVMVVSLIVGGALSPGSHVVEWFLGYLRLNGCIR